MFRAPQLVISGSLLLLKYKIGVVDSAPPTAGWLALWGVFGEMCYLMYRNAQGGALLTLQPVSSS